MSIYFDFSDVADEAESSLKKDGYEPYAKKLKGYSFLNKNNNNNNQFRIFEGDNLHTLSVLWQNKEMFDVIYIDPPYNTKSSGFAYKDSQKRSQWLYSLKIRLDLAKDLLSEDGLIFISIDEREHAYLKILCDQVFGEENFISDIVWQNKHTVSNDKKIGISSQVEYILLYGKNKKSIKIKGLPHREEYIKTAYRYDDKDGKGKYRVVPLYKNKNPTAYKVKSPSGKIWEKPWNYSEKNWKTLEKENKIYWGKENNALPQKKVYLKDTAGRPHSNLILGKDLCYQSQGGEDLQNLLGDKNIFMYPKPVPLLKYLIGMSHKENARVLDFYAGSGSTGQAVLEMNNEDGGERECLLATSNENNICRNVLLKRIKKVICNNQFEVDVLFYTVGVKRKT